MSKEKSPTLRFKNWLKFQHYKELTPPWIKLHRSLLDDLDYHSMTPMSAKLLPLAWLLASEYDGGLPSIETLSFRLRASTKEVQRALVEWNPYLEGDASAALAPCKREMSLETETETETEAVERQIASHDENPSCSAECVFTEIPCSGSKKTFQVMNEYIAEMRPLYPGVDIEKETLRAKGWILNNPLKRKTHNGMTKFLGLWYSREQNNGNNGDSKQPFLSPAIRREEAAKETLRKIQEEQDAKLRKNIV
jgi:hypothetical protein